MEGGDDVVDHADWLGDRSSVNTIVSAESCIETISDHQHCVESGSECSYPIFGSDMFDSVCDCEQDRLENGYCPHGGVHLYAVQEAEYGDIWDSEANFTLETECRWLFTSFTSESGSWDTVCWLNV